MTDSREEDQVNGEGFPTMMKSSRHGTGVIEIEPYDEESFLTDMNIICNNERKSPFSRSEVAHMFNSYPFGFRTPENCSSSRCRWIYPITYGGGLVGGDQVEARIVVGKKCCVVMCTQEMTKVYHCLQTDKTTTQTVNYTLQPHCLLCVLPDPLVCYKDARFNQKQTFHLSPSSNLVLLDWIHAGRQALGEFWSFQRYCSTIEMYFCNKLVLRECNDLETNNAVSLDKCMGKFQLLGSCIILGPHLYSLAIALEQKYSRKKGFGEQHSDSLVVSVSPLSYSVGDNHVQGCYLRFLAADMKSASVVVRDITNPLLDDLGADPFQRKL